MRKHEILVKFSIKKIFTTVCKMFYVNFNLPTKNFFPVGENVKFWPDFHFVPEKFCEIRS